MMTPAFEAGTKALKVAAALMGTQCVRILGYPTLAWPGAWTAIRDPQPVSSPARDFHREEGNRMNDAQKAFRRGSAPRQRATFGAQIRTYVLDPEASVKDHRTGVVTRDAAGVLDGDLDHFIQAELARRASPTK
jgi:hypothetical protein